MVFFLLQLTPSAFMKEIAQSTEEKLANTHEMRIPQIIELLDMGDNTYQKVHGFVSLNHHL